MDVAIEIETLATFVRVYASICRKHCQCLLHRMAETKHVAVCGGGLVSFVTVTFFSGGRSGEGTFNTSHLCAATCPVYQSSTLSTSRWFPYLAPLWVFCSCFYLSLVQLFILSSLISYLFSCLSYSMFRFSSKSMLLQSVSRRFTNSAFIIIICWHDAAEQLLN